MDPFRFTQCVFPISPTRLLQEELLTLVNIRVHSSPGFDGIRVAQYFSLFLTCSPMVSVVLEFTTVFSNSVRVINFILLYYLPLRFQFHNDMTEILPNSVLNTKNHSKYVFHCVACISLIMTHYVFDIVKLVSLQFSTTLATYVYFHFADIVGLYGD